MVKGITRRVIVVKPSDKLFDEAIFIVRDDPEERRGVTEEAIVKEARKAARDFMRSNLGARTRFSAYKLCWAAAGAISASVLWGAALLLFNFVF